MVVLGMTGPIGHGKSTLAKALANLEPSTMHFESSMIIAEVANALQSAINDLPDPYNVESLNNWLRALPPILKNVVRTEVTFDQIKLDQKKMEQHPIEYQKLVLHVENLHRQPDLLKHKITQENKENYRPFLQWLGGYLPQKVDAGIWYKEIARRIKSAESAGAKLCIVGGLRYPSDETILRSIGAKIILVYRPGHIQSDLLDPTERERQNIRSDCTIMSNGTVADVNKFAPSFYKSLLNGTLEATYRTVEV